MIRAVHQVLAACVALFAAAPTSAGTPLQLSSNVFVEREVTKADGSRKIVLAKPDLVTSGDDLVFVVRYRNMGSATTDKVVVTNPLPDAVLFNGTSDGREIVSVDGGKSWGTLGTLRIVNVDGRVRIAQRADVTHIKWILNQPLTAGAGGQLIFRGIVK